MIRYQFAILYSRRLPFAILTLILALLTLAAAYMGAFDSEISWIYTGWFGLLLIILPLILMHILKTRRAYDFFSALGMATEFQHAQTIVCMAPVSLYILLWYTACAIAIQNWTAHAANIPAMMTVAAISANTVFSNLQYRISSLRESKQCALIIVMSAPWLLTAWLIGLSTIHTENSLPQILALATLFLTQSGLAKLCP